MNESCVQDAPDDARRKRAFCDKTNHTTDLDLSERKLIFVTSLNRDAYETTQNCHFRPFHRSFSILLWVACKADTQETQQKSLLDSLERMDTTHMKPAFLKLIHQAVGFFPKQKAFILSCSYLYEDRGTLTNGVSINNDVFYFHPAYREAFEGGEWSIDNIYPNHYFLIDGKIVFVCLRMDACNQQEYYKKVYQQLVPNTGVLEEKNVVRIMVEHKQDQTRFAFDLFKLNIKPLRELIRPVKFVAPEP